MTTLQDSLTQLDARSLLALQKAGEREALRRAAKTNLIPFTEATFAAYRTADLHRQIAAALERVEQGGCDRLMVMCPPRHGKSELASRRFPAFYLGRHPEHHLISVSANFALAEEHGRDVRNLIRSQEYADIFDVQLAEDSQARGRFLTQVGGSFYAVGIGGSLYGRGADVMLIDDPVASMADARSPRIKDEIWSWFQGTAYNRLEKGGKIIVIAHRTALDDLQGRLLEQQAAGGDKWEVVELKAIDSEGRALWPEKYPIESLQRIKANTSPQDYSALYDQNPIATEGAFFKDEWIIPVDELPPRGRMAVYGGSDYALSSKATADYSVHVIVGVDVNRKMYLLDMWRKQAAPGVSVEALCDLILKWKPAFWADERVQVVAGLEPYILTRMRARSASCGRESFVTRGDKAVRASSIRGRMQLDGLRVLSRAPWLSDLRAELTAFPNGRHDDIVDALGLVGQLMDLWAAGNLPAAKAALHPGPESFKDYAQMGDRIDEAANWKTA